MWCVCKFHIKYYLNIDCHCFEYWILDISKMTLIVHIWIWCHLWRQVHFYTTLQLPIKYIYFHFSDQFNSYGVVSTLGSCLHWLWCQVRRGTVISVLGQCSAPGHYIPVTSPTLWTFLQTLQPGAAFHIMQQNYPRLYQTFNWSGEKYEDGTDVWVLIFSISFLQASKNTAEKTQTIIISHSKTSDLWLIVCSTFYSTKCSAHVAASIKLIIIDQW